ncbi:MAG: germination protein YpeB [Oscillospiraceae bacterium]|nr:germination protein YpeB [Oscillospiraceae bacterium]
MKKRTTVRIISFLSAAVVVAGVLAWTGGKKARSLELYARANTQRAFEELVTSVSEMSTALEKSVYITDPALEGAMCTQIFGRALTAQSAMGELPYSSQELEQAASFVAKVGDYACTLSRTVGVNGGYSREELENLKSLSETASVMAANLQDVQARLQAGELTMDEVYTAASAGTGDEEDQAPLAGTAFQTIEEEFPELPSLIYDGPFSEGLTTAEPAYLDGMEQIDEAAAQKAAARFMDVETGAVSVTGEVGGNVPCWVCSVRMNNGDYSVYVTKQGGQIYSALCSRGAGEEKYSVDVGLSIARSLLDSWGIEDMEESYHIVENGVLLVNYEYAQDGVLCYPDLIKVGVALDNGTLMRYDAQGYIGAHTERTLPEVAVTREEAQESLAVSLDVTGHNLAVIPSDGGEERLCHEFICQTEAGEHYLLYVNAVTGAEEKILILLEDESGTLTI